MVEGVDQFADRWEAELIDDTAGDSTTVAYDVEVMPAPIG